MKIRNKIIFIIVPIVFAIIVASYIGSLKIAKDILSTEIATRISAEGEKQKENIEKNLNNAKQIAKDLSLVVVSIYQDKKLSEQINILQEVVQDNKFILGAGIWFEPYVFDKNKKYIGPYVYKNGNELKTTFDYSNEVYDYFQQDFYVLAKEKKQMEFTDMYFDQTSGLYMLTCSQPLKDDKGQFIGCISVDIDLSSMQNLIADYSSKHNGTAYIINGEGQYLAAENVDFVKNKLNITQNDNSSFRAISSSIVTNNEGKTYYSQNGERVNVYYSTLNDMGWKIVFEISERTVQIPIKELSGLFSIIFGVSLFFLIATIYVITKRNIDTPVGVLLDELEKIKSNSDNNNVSHKLCNRNDEFGAIGNSLQVMKKQLMQYQRNLEEALEENVAANEELLQQNEELIENHIQIRNSLNYSNSLMEAIPDTVFVLSSDGHFLDSQGDIDNLFLQKKDFIGKRISEIMPPEIAEPSMEKIKDTILTGETNKVEYEWTRNGITEYHELRILRWFDEKILAITRNITETHNYIKEIEYVGYHDQLTGLHNRSFFDKQVKELSVIGSYPMSIILSDLNGLKIINDSFGHEQGDMMLKKYANILKDSVREDALISRIGGDEFLVILPLSDVQETERLIKELSKASNGESINGVNLSVAFGYAILREKKQSMQDAIKKAEDSMYQTKLFEASSRRSKTIDLILGTLLEKNPREEKHSRRVAELCEKMAIKMGLQDDEVKRIRTAGILHDIGKIGIQEDLLNKPGSLSEDEYIELCKHPEIGYRILNTAPNMMEISDIILAHHERWDGKGYPKGLEGNETPLFSRIIAIADAYDAMTSDRSYRKALSDEVAVSEIKKNSGTQFDPDLALFFIEHVVMI